MEIEPLLSKLETLAPHFGRASDDLKTMVSRGRSGDFKGVMQNARLVLEALLRDLVTRELKGTPGKAMLDELISKFRQSANAGVVPTNILAHMGTVQAWGNLSAHDHAGSLSDDAVTVGKEEVAASLNSMVAILSWYAQRQGLAAAPAGSVAPVMREATRGPGLTLAVVVALLAVAAGGGGWFAFAKHESPGMASTAAGVEAAPGHEALDALYDSWSEPPPPAECRTTLAIADIANDFAKLEALGPKRGPEDWYLTARARFEAEHRRPGDEPTKQITAALERALGCPRFAAALHLLGRLKAQAGDLAGGTGDPKLQAEAVALFSQAISLEPKFMKARYNRATVLLKQSKFEAAAADLKTFVAAVPNDAAAQLLLAITLTKQNEQTGSTDGALKQQARAAYCEAARLGDTSAKERCEAP